MNHQTHAMLTNWLESGTEAQKAHARHRLAMPDTQPDYPSFGSMVVNAAATFADFVADGFALADDAEVERRLAVCRKCEFFDALQERCIQCGCHLNGKVRIAAAHCPLPDPKW